jgi:protoporphyrinogen oxidase
MWERCAALTVAAGGEVLLNHQITGLEMDGHRIVAAEVSTPDGERRMEAEHFISTMPLRSLVHALGSSAPVAVQQAAEGLAYRDFILVALILDKPKLFPDNWIYCHTPGIQVGRVQNFNNWSSALVPDPTMTCLGMEYFCFDGGALWRRPDKDLISMASRELEALGLGRGAKVIDANVVRMPKAYPIYDASYRSHVDTIRSFIDTIPNLHTIGRNGMHKYNNQDHSMYTAMLAVGNLEGANHDLWQVNNDFDYHEEQLITNHPTPSGGMRARVPTANEDQRRQRRHAAV